MDTRTKTVDPRTRFVDQVLRNSGRHPTLKGADIPLFIGRGVQRVDASYRTRSRVSDSDGQVEPESVVELAHEIPRHVTHQVADPFDSDRSHLFGLCLGIAVWSRLGGVQ